MASVTDTRWHTLSGNIAALELDSVERFGCYSRLHFEEREFTNIEELAHAGRLGRFLKDCGVKPGDRVVVILPNSPDLTAAFQAVWMIGAVIAPIMPTWTAEELLPVLANAEPACILTFPLLAPRIHAGLRALALNSKLLVFGESDVAGAVNIAPLLASAAPIETPEERSPSDLALLLYTSGTTAVPRGAMITHGNLGSALDSMSRLNHDIPPGPVLHALPLSHSFGLLLLNLANKWGCKSVLLRQFEPTRVLESIERHRVAYVPVVPTMLLYLLQHPELSRFNLKSLRRVISGGAALPEALRMAFEQACGCRVEQGYGLSETIAVVAAYGEHDDYRSGSAGRPAPGVEIRILDDENRPLGARLPGEICVAGKNITTGYWREPEATSAAFIGENLRTGDIGYTDEDGFIYITDRKKDLIIKGGENVSPREIEEALHAHPAVAAAAVVGIPDPLFGENICAVLQLKPGAEVTADEIRTFATRHVGKFKTPAVVEFWVELPRNFTGKIWKRAVRSRLLAKKAANV